MHLYKARSSPSTSTKQYILRDGVQKQQETSAVFCQASHERYLQNCKMTPLFSLNSLLFFRINICLQNMLFVYVYVRIITTKLFDLISNIIIPINITHVNKVFGVLNEFKSVRVPT